MSIDPANDNDSDAIEEDPSGLDFLIDMVDDMDLPDGARMAMIEEMIGMTADEYAWYLLNKDEEK